MSLVTEETQIEITARHHHTSTRMARLKQQTIQVLARMWSNGGQERADEGSAKLELGAHLLATENGAMLGKSRGGAPQKG